MRKTGIIIFIALIAIMSITDVNMAIGIETAALETSPSIPQQTNNVSNNESETVTVSEVPTNKANQEQLPRNSGENSGLNQVNPRAQSLPSADNPSANNIIINSLPEMPPSEEPDTLSKILDWWAVNPVEMKFWHLFIILSAVLFLYRQTSFRKPLLFASLVVFGFYFGNAVNPINSIFSLPVQTGTKLVDSIIIVALPIVISLFLGRFFCGWVCPAGAVQELIHPEKFAFQLPPLIDKILASLRYLLLIGGIVFSWSALANIWNNNDPFHGLFTFKRSALSAILLVLVLTASMFIERFYCRYLCPLGAVLAITSRFSLFKLKPESELCIACGKCSQPKACPMQVIVTTNPYTDLPHIKPADCIVCYRCVDICRYSALKLSINKKKKQSKDRHPEQTQSF